MRISRPVRKWKMRTLRSLPVMANSLPSPDTVMDHGTALLWRRIREPFHGAGHARHLAEVEEIRVEAVERDLLGVLEAAAE